MVSRAHISYRHHCAPHESGLSSCCTQPYYRDIDCQKVSSSFPECAQTSWPVDYYIPVWCDEGVFVRKKQPFGQSFKQSVSHPAIWSVSHSLPISHIGSQSNNESANQLCRQSVKQSVYQSVMQAVSQTVSLPISYADRQSNSQSTNQSCKQSPISHTGRQSSSQSTNQSCRHSIKQSVYQSVMQTVGQTVSLPISHVDSQSNSQSTNQACRQSVIHIECEREGGRRGRKER